MLNCFCSISVLSFCMVFYCKRNLDSTNVRVYAGSKNNKGIKCGKYTNDLLM